MRPSTLNRIDMVDKIVGSIVGGAIGDAFGSPFQNNTAPEVSDQHPWRLTDDTQLTLATCEAMIRTWWGVDPSRIAKRFAMWHRASKVIDMGLTTTIALNRLVHGAHWASAGATWELASGNGSAMRAGPLATRLDPSDPRDRDRIHDVSRITHKHLEAYAGALAIVAAVRSAWTGAWRGDENLIALVTPLLPDTLVRDRLLAIQSLGSGHSIVDVASLFGASSYVIESIPLAIYAAQKVGKLGFENLMYEVASAGGDTDSNCSMAGQIVGALLGYGALPSKWLNRLPEREFVERVATQFALIDFRKIPRKSDLGSCA